MSLNSLRAMLGHGRPLAIGRRIGLVACQRLLEATNPRPERASKLGQSLGAEHQEQDDAEDKPVRRVLKPAEHARIVLGPRFGVAFAIAGRVAVDARMLGRSGKTSGKNPTPPHREADDGQRGHERPCRPVSRRWLLPHAHAFEAEAQLAKVSIRASLSSRKVQRLTRGISTSPTLLRAPGWAIERLRHRRALGQFFLALYLGIQLGPQEQRHPGEP